MAIETGNSYIGAAIARGNQNITQSSERLVSGLRINSAADDAAGTAIVNRLQSQESEYSQATRNAGDGISLAQTAAADLTAVTKNLQRIRELAIQASSGLLQDADRSALNTEAQQLRLEVARITGSSDFNGVPLLNNSNPVNLVLGSGLANQITLETPNLEQVLKDEQFGTIDFSSAKNAQGALSIVDRVQARVNEFGSQLGATVNTLESSINQLGNAGVAAAESRSRISDTDFAKETSALAKEKVRQDVAVALQAQANNQRGDLTLRLLSQQV